MNHPTPWLSTLAALLLTAAFGAAPALAQDKALPADQVDFSKVQSECVQTSAIRFGPQERWQDCRIMHSGFVATIGLQDFYYADYCLDTAEKQCVNQALVMYRNRGYRSEAFLDLVRIDPTGTRYDSPLLIGSADENVLATAVRLPGKETRQRRYYRYEQDHWLPIDGTAWLQQLQARLPAGLHARVSPQDALPEPRTMELSVPLYRKADRNCCATGGRANVRLSIEAGQLELADLSVVRGK
jgi:hypothetical protein